MSDNTEEKEICNTTGLCTKIPIQQKYEYTWECAWSVISGKSGRGDKLELGEFWMWPKDQGGIKSPFFSLLWECSNCAFDSSKFLSCNFQFCCQFCNCSAAVECKDDIFSKECFKKKKIGTAIPPKINYVHEFSTALWSTHPMVSHGDALLQFNLCDRSILQQAQCSRRDSGVFGFKQHKENLWMAQLWAATYKKWFLKAVAQTKRWFV